MLINWYYSKQIATDLLIEDKSPPWAKIDCKHSLSILYVDII